MSFQQVVRNGYKFAIQPKTIGIGNSGFEKNAEKSITVVSLTI
jgi:hypothetical protein